jgi:hypothetical protein
MVHSLGPIFLTPLASTLPSAGFVAGNPTRSSNLTLVADLFCMFPSASPLRCPPPGTRLADHWLPLGCWPWQITQVRRLTVNIEFRDPEIGHWAGLSRRAESEIKMNFSIDHARLTAGENSNSGRASTWASRRWKLSEWGQISPPFLPPGVGRRISWPILHERFQAEERGFKDGML